jgi:hypothetical protein
MSANIARSQTAGQCPITLSDTTGKVSNITYQLAIQAREFRIVAFRENLEIRSHSAVGASDPIS